MPENLTNRNQCHKCHKTGERKKDKLHKCSRCHSITYCSEECQEADWDRHKPNCVPVMVKDYEEKGQGLVAARHIEMGEQILVDKAMVSRNGINGCLLTRDAERLLINKKILGDISLLVLNHSCAPNAAMGLLDGDENEELENRIELRAIKEISKEEEVTIFYPTERMGLPWLHANMKEKIHEEFGIDCKCPVCSGEVANQDDIMRTMTDIIISSGMGRKHEDDKTLTDWTREAISNGALVELVKPVYMGRPDMKTAILLSLWKSASAAEKPALVEKSLDEFKELAEKTGLEAFKGMLQKIK